MSIVTKCDELEVLYVVPFKDKPSDSDLKYVTQAYLKTEADKVIAGYQEKIIVLEKSYKKLVKKFVHETSVAESYRSLIYKEDALKYQEVGNSEMYDELSKKSDKAYRHANRWRRIFRKMSQE